MEASHDLTRTGDIVGTPQYMAPEQASGQSNRLMGQGQAYARELSTVALLQGAIIGVLLVVPDGDAMFIETRAVDTAHRGSWINLGLMHHAAVAARQRQVRAIEFEGTATDRDTTKLARRLGAVPVERRQTWGGPVASAAAVPLAAATVPPSPTLRTSHTPSFPALLDTLGASLAVTTYQAGKLVFLRADNGVLNTHFRSFNVPMGLAVDGPRLAIGTALEIWEFHDAPAVAQRLEPAGRHDACYLPRGSHTTGNVQIHEMAWGLDDELWFVNTRFSCLATHDRRYNFVPRWKPSFISALAPEDRCHLNGLALVDGRPRYVTALAISDQPGGWRPYKRAGGVVIDVASGEVVCRGLSMPHSPRWDGERLWVLNSGEGGLGIVDPHTGAYEEVARLPGFTRGLEIVGDHAFIGLSQVRESAVFSGIAIAARPVEERHCGVWVVDLRTGVTVALVRFEDGVQEIFAVHALPGTRFPDLINDDHARLADSFVLPEDSLEVVSRPYVRRAS